jgi:hypothetical protein
VIDRSFTSNEGFVVARSRNAKTHQTSQTGIAQPPSRLSACFNSSRPIKRIASLTVLAVGLLGGLANGSSAAPISTPPRSLMAITVPGAVVPPVPTVYVWDNFVRPALPNNPPIGTAIVGGAWTQNMGTWSVVTSTQKLRIAAATVNGNVTIGLGSVLDAQVDATFTFNAASNSGVVLNDDGAQRIIVLYRKTTTGGGIYQLRLYVWTSGATLPAPVATANVTSLTAASIKVIANGSSIQAFWNGAGAPVISYTLTAPEIAAVKNAGSNRFGVWSENDGGDRFDDFRVQSL